MSLTNRTLQVFQFLWQTTDEDHPASIADITKYLETQNINADPRKLRKDIDQLIEFGIDIVKDRRVQNQYHVASRHFEAPEVRLLIDAVQSARFITPAKSHALIARLSTFAAPHQNEILNRKLYTDIRAKAKNESIYISVDRIQSAIAEKRKVRFRYFDYSPTKEKVYRHEGQIYYVSPYAMLWSSDTYYMVGFHDFKGFIAKFRVDRIDRLEVTGEQSVPTPRDFNVSEYFAREFSMLGGKKCRVRLLCENVLMNSIIDRFGEDVHTEISDGRHFIVETEVDLSSNFYGWVFASGGKMRIVAPDEAVEGFRNMLECYYQPDNL